MFNGSIDVEFINGYSLSLDHCALPYDRALLIDFFYLLLPNYSFDDGCWTFKHRWSCFSSFYCSFCQWLNLEIPYLFLDSYKHRSRWSSVPNVLHVKRSKGGCMQFVPCGQQAMSPRGVKLSGRKDGDSKVFNNNSGARTRISLHLTALSMTGTRGYMKNS